MHYHKTKLFKPCTSRLRFPAMFWSAPQKHIPRDFLCPSARILLESPQGLDSHALSLPSLARLDQKHSDPLRTSRKLTWETCRSSSHVARSPLVLLVSIMLRSCCHLCPKVRQALAAGGAFQHLGSADAWSLDADKEKKPKQSGHGAVFSYFPVISG